MALDMECQLAYLIFVRGNFDNFDEEKLIDAISDNIIPSDIPVDILEESVELSSRYEPENLVRISEKEFSFNFYIHFDVKANDFIEKLKEDIYKIRYQAIDYKNFMCCGEYISIEKIVLDNIYIFSSDENEYLFEYKDDKNSEYIYNSEFDIKEPSDE